MDNLQNYLNDEYKKEKEQFREVEKLIQKSLPIFNQFDVSYGWPYELNSELTKISSSTTAMLTFAMSVLKGGKLDLAVNSEERCNNYFDKQYSYLESYFDSAKKLLSKNFGESKVEGKGKNSFDSGTYGINDPFTLMWVRHIFKDEKTNWDDFEECCIGKVKYVFENIYKSWDDLKYSNEKIKKTSPIEKMHIFPLLKTIQLYTTFNHDELNIKSNQLDAVKDMLRNRLHYHLSLSCIENSNFDAAELVFALEGLLLLNDNKKNFDDSLLDSVFGVITDRQNISLYWRPLKPFVCNEQGLALLPLSVEIAMSLIRICRLLDKKGEKLFSKNFEVFNKYTQWLKTRTVIVTGPDKKGNKETYYGWCSEHIDQPNKIHLWETSQVLVYLANFNNMLQKNIAYKSLKYSNLSWKNYPHEQIKLSGFLAKLIAGDAIKIDEISNAINFVNENNTISEADYVETLKNYISKLDYAKKLFAAYCLEAKRNNDEIKLFKWKTEEPVQYLAVYKDICNNYIIKDDACSMLLYGPPGTGKTFIVEQIAAIKEWPLITITPSDFIANGADQVETKAKNIFTVLMEQKNVVVLFDEIDRLIMDRDAPLYFKQGDMFQFMTPSMLVKIKDLRVQAEKSKIIFVICTNYNERIDPAIKRAGRIDKRFLVLPPDLSRREKIVAECFAKKLISDRFNEEKFEEIVKLIAQKTPYYSYTEIDQLCKDFYKKYKVKKAKDESANIDQLLKEVMEPSTISLLNYSEKLGIKVEEKTIQKPIDEFFSLLLLKAEIEAKNEKSDQIELFLSREKKLAVELLKFEYTRDKLTNFLESLDSTFKKSKEDLNKVKQSFNSILMGEIAEEQNATEKGILTQIKEELSKNRAE